MKYTVLPGTDIKVSTVCLGTMTFGEQNTEADAHAQLDYAFERGVNFIDTAEMYPVPPNGQTYSRTESYIGNWLVRQPRDKLIVATKVAGPGRMEWIRGGSFTAAGIRTALEASLKRLRTDYVDLYQIHWPARYVPIFGQSRFEPERERQAEPIEAQLEVLAQLKREGKLRAIGVSNESAWGVCEFTRLARERGLPRIATVQNAYNLVNRSFEQGLDEACFREQVGLLAYSPLAFGRLSGKYNDDPQAHGRLTLFPPTWSPRYMRPKVIDAAGRYAALARAHGLTPAALALAFCASRFFATSTIIGATTLAQLREDIDAFDLTLAPEVLEAIEAIHAELPNPAQ
jgi:aryl-alcohol dehydrogenase-like predicted oxidoreductase